MSKDEAWDIMMNTIRLGGVDDVSIVNFVEMMDHYVERPDDEWKRIRETGIASANYIPSREKKEDQGDFDF